MGNSVLTAKARIGVVVFPGSNCDKDCVYVARDVMKAQVKEIWHQDKEVGEMDAIMLPGGFSYGDYLRTGAIARFSPIMKSVIEFANKGKFVLGICNGFQILLESGLLPGAMLRNESLKFECRFVYLRVESTNSPFTSKYKKGQVLRIPIAHGEGNYYTTPEILKDLQQNDQILFRYCTQDGQITKGANPNGSLDNIAGICNKSRNVLGMMPHPERASDPALHSTDGQPLFDSLLASL